MVLHIPGAPGIFAQGTPEVDLGAGGLELVDYTPSNAPNDPTIIGDEWTFDGNDSGFTSFASRTADIAGIAVVNMSAGGSPPLPSSQSIWYYGPDKNDSGINWAVVTYNRTQERVGMLVKNSGFITSSETPLNSVVTGVDVCIGWRRGFGDDSLDLNVNGSWTAGAAAGQSAWGETNSRIGSNYLSGIVEGMAGTIKYLGIYGPASYPSMAQHSNDIATIMSQFGI